MNPRNGSRRTPSLAVLAPVISALLFCGVSSAHTGTILGRVLDDSGSPLAYGSVLVKGHGWGATVDTNGVFRIAEIPTGTYTLVARAVGFTSSERVGVPVRKNKTASVDFTLTQRVIRTSRGVVIVGERPSVLIQSEHPLTPAEDSLALFGAWELVDSGGDVAVRNAPGSRRQNIHLHFREDGTYVVRAGSPSDSLECTGAFFVHRLGGRLENGRRASLWIETQGCNQFLWERNLVSFSGRDTMMTYPGGGNVFVIDGSLTTYVRDPIPEPEQALQAAWRWTRSYGGWGSDIRPPPSGWSRFLYFTNDETYSFWEEDSVENYRISSGRFTLHPRGTARPQPWIELPGWSGSFGGGEGNWIQFLGPDTLTLYPGGGDQIVSDSNTEVFVREKGKRSPSGTETSHRASWQPPRLWQYSSGAYDVYLPTALLRVRESIGRLNQWTDSGYGALSYQYTNNQIPSAVIGDFDGDSLADVAIHGWSDKTEKLVCLFSNHAAPRATTLFAGPVAVEGRGRVRPTFFLEFCPAGEVFYDSLGNSRTTESDAIRVVSAGRKARIYYYDNGVFRRGKSNERGGRSNER